MSLKSAVAKKWDCLEEEEGNAPFSDFALFRLFIYLFIYLRIYGFFKIGFLCVDLIVPKLTL